MDLSIIIVNWNTRRLLAECLRSIERNLSEGLRFEIIVIDNASSDGSAEMVKREFPYVLLIANTSNLGFVRANNQGAVLAKGRYLLLLNSDTVVLDGGIKKVLFYLDSHSDVGVATGKVLYSNKRFQRPFRRFPHWLGATFRHTIQLVVMVKPPFEKKFRLEYLSENGEHEVDWVFGAYMFIRKDVLTNGKVFDEDIFMWAEDTLFCHNTRSRGYKVMYLPYAPIIHYAGESRRKVPVESAYNSFKGSVIYFKKIYGSILAERYSFLVRSIWCIFAVCFTACGIIPIPKIREKARLFRSLSSK